MGINWGDLGEVLVASLVATVCVVALFSVGVIGLSRQTTAKEQGTSGAAPLTGAVICFAACLLIVAYGIYLIVV
ncbi:MAG TPA: hypothetical protein VHX38_10950 [Pseudonocardiaceae bacterium]|jgi:uncharacterized membrane protein YhiD involved in acid resistance|nr:hypothetical protein [Pseudonocardiaceae bacterium]